MKSMEHEKPEVGSVVKAWIGKDPSCDVEVAGYFDKTRSVFLYEAPFTPLVVEWDDVMWTHTGESLARELEEDIEEWNYSDSRDSVAEHLIRQGWRKE